MDALPHDHPPAILWEAKKPRTHRRRRNAALFVGALIILDDGSACHIVAFTANGQPLCAPHTKDH